MVPGFWSLSVAKGWSQNVPGPFIAACCSYTLGLKLFVYVNVLGLLYTVLCVAFTLRRKRKSRPDPCSLYQSPRHLPPCVWPSSLVGEKAGYSTVAMANAAPQPTWKLAAPVSSPSRIISLFPSTNCFFANVGGLLSSGAAEHCCRNQAERPHPRRGRASGVWRGCKSTHFVCVCVCVTSLCWCCGLDHSSFDSKQEVKGKTVNFNQTKKVCFVYFSLFQAVSFLFTESSPRLSACVSATDKNELRQPGLIKHSQPQADLSL